MLQGRVQFTQRREQEGQVAVLDGEIGMPLGQFLGKDGQRTAGTGHGGGMVAAAGLQRRQVAQQVGHAAAPAAVRFGIVLQVALHQLDGPAVDLLGRIQLLAAHQHDAQIVEQGHFLGRAGLADLVQPGQRLAEEGLGLVVTVVVTQQSGQPVEHADLLQDEIPVAFLPAGQGLAQQRFGQVGCAQHPVDIAERTEQLGLHQRLVLQLPEPVDAALQQLARGQVQPGLLRGSAAGTAPPCNRWRPGPCGARARPPQRPGAPAPWPR